MSSPESQQLYAVNTTTSIDDNLLAPVKDPLWFLAMQWRTGEFEAENGGVPTTVEVRSVEHPLTHLERDGLGSELDPARPLEYDIEREDDDGASPAWRSAALAYGVEASTSRHRLRAADYPGDRLDWYHFDLVETSDGEAGSETTRELLPAALRVRGAPDPRWWRFESAGDESVSPVDPEPNVLSTLLPEFSFIDANNWFMVPLVQQVGSVREITGVRITDSFGVATELGPAVTSWRRGAWGVFGLAGSDDAVDGCDGRLLFVPNIALDVLNNDEVEEVRFVRDEEANLVWAYERLYRDAAGNAVHNGDATGDAVTAGGDEDPGEPAEGNDLDLRYVLAGEVPPWWTPYIPRFIAPRPGVDGQIYLRRARTVEDTSAGTQHRTRVVEESWRLDEHEIPRTGLRVRRLRRSARGSDGTSYHWVGRSRQTGQQAAHPDRRYDYLEGD